MDILGWVQVNKEFFFLYIKKRRHLFYKWTLRIVNWILLPDYVCCIFWSLFIVSCYIRACYHKKSKYQTNQQTKEKKQRLRSKPSYRHFVPNRPFPSPITRKAERAPINAMVFLQPGFGQHFPGTFLPGLSGSGDWVRPVVRGPRGDRLHPEHAAHQTHLWEVWSKQQTTLAV